MSKQLEHILNLAPENTPEPNEPDIEEAKQEIREYEALSTDADKIDAALPPTSLSTIDSEMDELADTAKQAFEELRDLGMNCDTKYAGRIFEVAGTMLGHAVTAKTTKINNKLKTIDMQLKKARLDLQTSGKSTKDDAVESDGEIVDRNELLNDLLSKMNDKS